MIYEYDAFDVYVKGYKTGYVDGVNAVIKELILEHEKNYKKLKDTLKNV